MRRTLGAVGIAVLCLASAGPASATFPGANGRIAYDDPPADPSAIHSVLPSGGGDKRLGIGLMPSWSPNGQRIVFARGVNGQPEIYSMAADGSHGRRLTYRQWSDTGPSYSPSGHRIVFTETRSTASWVMRMRSDGSEVRTLGTGVAFDWSPDGRWIGFVLGRTSRYPPSIWAMHPNGTDRHRLLFLGSQGGSGPHYFPDGTKFAFSRCGDKCRYFVAKSDGSSVRQLPCPPGYFRGTTAPSYSPNGRRLLGETSGLNTVTLPLHSCSPTVVTKGGSGTLPAWQPLPAP
jgi:TolB protein